MKIIIDDDDYCSWSWVFDEDVSPQQLTAILKEVREQIKACNIRKGTTNDEARRNVRTIDKTASGKIGV